MGRTGLIASAGLYIAGRACYITTLQSDLCQQLYRHAELTAACKTQVEARFHRWYRLLLNAVLDYCIDLGLDTVLCPTGSTIFKYRAKPLLPTLFYRIYDDPPNWLACPRTRLGHAEFWAVHLSDNAGRIVRLARRESAAACVSARGSCVFHDIEGPGDTAMSADDCDRALSSMLDRESEAGIEATYSVVGTMFRHVKPRLAAHKVRSIAFHSYNHCIGEGAQLKRVREIDLRVKGYRPPQSIITQEVTAASLTYYNFEWLLSSSQSLRTLAPLLHNGIVRIPVHLDDYPLYAQKLPLGAWINHVADLLSSPLPVVVIGLHDCYARSWMPEYPRLLEWLKSRGEVWTCDRIAEAAFLQSDGIFTLGTSGGRTSPYEAATRATP